MNKYSDFISTSSDVLNLLGYKLGERVSSPNDMSGLAGTFMNYANQVHSKVDALGVYMSDSSNSLLAHFCDNMRNIQKVEEDGITSMDAVAYYRIQISYDEYRQLWDIFELMSEGKDQYNITDSKGRVICIAWHDGWCCKTYSPTEGDVYIPILKWVSGEGETALCWCSTFLYPLNWSPTSSESFDSSGCATIYSTAHSAADLKSRQFGGSMSNITFQLTRLCDTLGVQPQDNIGDTVDMLCSELGIQPAPNIGESLTQISILAGDGQGSSRSYTLYCDNKVTSIVAIFSDLIANDTVVQTLSDIASVAQSSDPMSELDGLMNETGIDTIVDSIPLKNRKGILRAAKSAFSACGKIGLVNYLASFMKQGSEVTSNGATLEFVRNSNFVPKVYLSGVVNAAIAGVGAVISVIAIAVGGVWGVAVSCVTALASAIANFVISKPQEEEDVSLTTYDGYTGPVPIMCSPVAGLQASGLTTTYLSELVANCGGRSVCDVPGGKLFLGYDDSGKLVRAEFHPAFFRITQCYTRDFFDLQTKLVTLGNNLFSHSDWTWVLYNNSTSAARFSGVSDASSIYCKCLRPTLRTAFALESFWNDFLTLFDHARGPWSLQELFYRTYPDQTPSDSLEYETVASAALGQFIFMNWLYAKSYGVNGKIGGNLAVPFSFDEDENLLAQNHCNSIEFPMVLFTNWFIKSSTASDLAELVVTLGRTSALWQDTSWFVKMQDQSQNLGSNWQVCADFIPSNYNTEEELSLTNYYASNLLFDGTIYNHSVEWGPMAGLNTYTVIESVSYNSLPTSVVFPYKIPKYVHGSVLTSLLAAGAVVIATTAVAVAASVKWNKYKRQKRAQNVANFNAAQSDYQSALVGERTVVGEDGVVRTESFDPSSADGQRYINDCWKSYKKQARTNNMSAIIVGGSRYDVSSFWGEKDTEGGSSVDLSSYLSQPDVSTKMSGKVGDVSEVSGESMNDIRRLITGLE